MLAEAARLMHALRQRDRDLQRCRQADLDSCLAGRSAAAASYRPSWPGRRSTTSAPRCAFRPH